METADILDVARQPRPKRINEFKFGPYERITNNTKKGSDVESHEDPRKDYSPLSYGTTTRLKLNSTLIKYA